MKGFLKKIIQTYDPLGFLVQRFYLQGFFKIGINKECYNKNNKFEKLRIVASGE